jgi:uncharacterized NAD-dependent epimerase/dehydratase family protein
MNTFPEGNAIVYCEGAFSTPNGKTAHGLVRRTRKYNVLSVIDSVNAGFDAGFLLNGKKTGIPIFKDIVTAVESTWNKTYKPTHFVIGLAPDGGKLSPEARKDVLAAINCGLNVDSGLHDFLSEDDEIISLAEKHGVQIRDVRKPPDRKNLHFFTGKINEVTSFKVALLGTDSAVGKRTTAWILHDALIDNGICTEMIGTGQTAWMQGVKYGLILDSIINDFVAGEIEHAVWSAWNDLGPDVIIIEGQGSMMNPAYPGGFEVLAAGRPDVVVLQHAPARKYYDGFPGYGLHPLEEQIQAIQLISGKPVIAVTINHENLKKGEIARARQRIRNATGLPAVDVLTDGPDQLINVVLRCMTQQNNQNQDFVKPYSLT